MLYVIICVCACSWNETSMTFKGTSNEKEADKLGPYIESGHASELNLHDHGLHLIITWNLRPIKKCHASLH